MNYVTIKNGVASPIERKQLYYASKPPLVIINETNNTEDIIVDKTVHIDGYNLEQIKKYKYLHVKLIVYNNTVLANDIASIHKNDFELAAIAFTLNDYTNYLHTLFLKDYVNISVEHTNFAYIVEKTFINDGQTYIDIEDASNNFTETILERIINVGDFKIKGYNENNIKGGFSTFQIYFSNNINPTF